MKKLTKAEINVLKLVEKWYKNIEIAEELHVTVHTVKAHLTSIMHKLEAVNRYEAVYVARKNKLMD